MLLLPVLLTLASTTAVAASNSPYMWGAGPSVSTIAWPGAYPHSFPSFNDKVSSLPGENSELSPQNALSQSKGGFWLAGRGVVYLKRTQRLGVRLNTGWGGGMRALQTTVEFEQSLIRESNINIFAGGGVGLGKLSFSEDSAKLSMSTYVARAQVSAIYRNSMGKKNKADDQAYELSLFMVLYGTGPESYTNGDLTAENPSGINLFSGLTSDESDDKQLKGGMYSPYIGIEGTVFFGDLTPPSSGKKKSNNKKKSKSKKEKTKV